MQQHIGEYLQHLSIAQASLGELDAQLEIAKRLDYVPPELHEECSERIQSLGRQIRQLRINLSSGNR